MKCFMYGKNKLQDVEVCDANNSGDARVRSGGNEETFNQQAQRAMT